MKKTLIIVDTSVLSHQIAASEELLKAFRTRPPFAVGLIKAQLGYIASGDWGELENPDVLWALDQRDTQGEYWRHSYLRDFDIAYKANRKQKPVQVLTIIGLVVEILNRKKAAVMGVPGYEADDIAAAAVQVLDHYDQIIALTTDTDWMGLISDGRGHQPRTFWVASEPRHTPQIRHNLDSINVWTQKRFKINLDDPKAIWEYKAENGDKSDNLPPESPLEVIDLFNPPAPFNLSQNPQIKELIQEIVKLRGTHKGGEECRRHLKDAGVRPTMLPILQKPW